MAKLTKPARDRISATKFACPKQRKEPLENASHVAQRCGALQSGEGRYGSGTSRGVEADYSLPQSETEWNMKGPDSANTPRSTPAMAATAG